MRLLFVLTPPYLYNTTVLISDFSFIKFNKKTLKNIPNKNYKFRLQYKPSQRYLSKIPLGET